MTAPAVAPAAIEYIPVTPFLTEVRQPRPSRTNRETLDSDVAIIINSKDHSDRLERTLDSWTATGLETVVLDDSSRPNERRRTERLAGRAGAKYHGQHEQRALLNREGVSLRSGFISPLGSSGWTLGRCRNYALLLGLAEGYDRLLLADDDILPRTRSTPTRSLSLLDEFDFVGARTTGFPDDSVVGHIARRVGVVQYDFITGQYLALRSNPREYFFPDVYNEDLIFLLLQVKRAKMARWGRVSQLVPSGRTLSISRAITQELGEVHFEGLVQASRVDGESLLTSRDFWTEILDFRRRCLEDLLTRRGVKVVPRDFLLLRRVLAVSRQLNPAVFADFYERYAGMKTRWIALQSRIMKSH